MLRDMLRSDDRFYEDFIFCFDVKFGDHSPYKFTILCYRIMKRLYDKTSKMSKLLKAQAITF